MRFIVGQSQYLAIIGRGNEQIYRDLSVASKSIIDLRDTDKSRYFAITKFNNCFIIQSRS